MATDDYSPIYQNDTGAMFNPQFVRANGSYVNLTDATITMRMVNINDASDVHVAAGTWTIDSDPTTGKASYAYDASDVAVVGIRKLFISITVGGKPIHADVKLLEIKALV
jgi:hypothetical protein